MLRAALGFPQPDGCRMEPARTAHGAVAAFFDVDNTLVRGTTLFRLAAALHRDGWLTTSDLRRFLSAQLRYSALGEGGDLVEDLRERALGLLVGHDVAALEQIADRLYRTELPRRLYPGATALLDAHLAAGHQVWLVTATPSELGCLVADLVGAHGCLATVAERVDGRYTGRLAGPAMHGARKAEAVRELAEREGLDLEASYAYGDSANDLAVLGAVGHPVAVNADRRLRRSAVASGWPCHDFRRGRNAARLVVPAAAAAAVAVTVAVARGSRTCA